MQSSRASTIFTRLSGIVCLYKPSDICPKYLKNSFASRICKDLNKLEDRPTKNYLEIKEGEKSQIIVDVRPSYADNVLAAGPRYQPQDVHLTLTPIGWRTSGVCVLGISKGAKSVKRLILSNPTKTYHIKGILGQTTQYLYKDEKIVGKASFAKVKKNTIDKILASFQAAHQRKIFTELGINIQSQEAYDLATQGLLRLGIKGITGIYSLKCIDFQPPDFTIEAVCLNENEDYFLQLVYDLGLQLRTLAHCTGLRCIRYGPFTVKDALSQKNWTLENAISNVNHCHNIFHKERKSLFSPFVSASNTNYEAKGSSKP